MPSSTQQADTTQLANHVAWISGAGSGIGRASAIMLSQAGVKVALMGRRKEALQKVADAITAQGGKVVVCALDVQDRAAIQAMSSELLTHWGKVNLLVNNAGLNVPVRRLHAIADSDWDLVVSVNLNGAYNLIQAVLPAMRKQQGGLIINVSSMAGKQASGLSGAAYTASKHGLNGLNHAINLEEWKHGIRSTVICPGEVNTEILDKRPIQVPTEDRDQMMAAEDIAEAVMFLARLSPKATVSEMLMTPTHKRTYQPGELG